MCTVDDVEVSVAEMAPTAAETPFEQLAHPPPAPSCMFERRPVPAA